MPDMEKVKKGVWQCWLPSTEEEYETQCHDCPYYEPGITLEECMKALRTDTIAMLNEQELPTELKHKMWNALYAEEDEYEKKFVGKEEHLNWFTVYRPWLQKGFDIAINAIADWEGR